MTKRIIRDIGKLAAILIGLLSVIGCKKDTIPNLNDYTPLSISEISSNKLEFIGQKIMAAGYILGSELRQNSKNGDIFVLVLGDKPLEEENSKNSLVFPKVDHKIRVGEDGFNREIINRCNEICDLARNKGEQVIVYGIYSPAQGFHQYTSGIDLMLDAIEINGLLIDTDFNDHGKIKEKTPSVMRKLYKGGEGVAKIIKKGLL